MTHAGSAEWEGEGDLDSAQDSNKNCIFYSTLLVRIIIYTQLLWNSLLHTLHIYNLVL